MIERHIPHESNETQNDVRGMSDESFVVFILYTKTAQGLTPNAHQKMKQKNYDFNE